MCFLGFASKIIVNISIVNTVSYILILLSAVFFESVKSELRNGSSEYSDISDSEESEPDCTTQVHLEKSQKLMKQLSAIFVRVVQIYLVKVCVKAVITKYLILVQINIWNNLLLHSIVIVVLRKKIRYAILPNFIFFVIEVGLAEDEPCSGTSKVWEKLDPSCFICFFNNKSKLRHLNYEHLPHSFILEHG